MGNLFDSRELLVQLLGHKLWIGIVSIAMDVVKIHEAINHLILVGWSSRNGL